VQYVLASTNDSGYSDADDVTGDIVLEQHQTGYDSVGRVVVQASISRYHTDTTSPTGSLDTGLSTPTAFTLAGLSPDVLGRIQISAMWYDVRDRVTDTAQYGTNGGSDFSYPGSVPSRSDTVLVSTSSFNDDGTLLQVEDPKGIKTRYTYDDAGRRTKVTSNWVDGSPSSTTADDDQIVQYAYTDGLQTSITAYVDGGSNDQVTTYFHGVTKGTNPGDSRIASNALIAKVQYPDAADSTNDVVKFAYNAQGQQIWKKDQYVTSPSTAGGNIIETTYDSAGRETSRAVTTPGTGFDTAVLRIETAYTALGQVETVTQYDAASSGSVVDQVKYLYDGWGNVTNFRQDIDGTVGGSGYYDVAYAYEKATTGRNTIRRTSETLGGKTFSLNYASSGSPDVADVSSRVYSIKDGATPLVQYEYLGAGQVVGTMYDEPDVFSRQYGSTAGQYPDLDTLNRVVGSKWTKDLSTDVDFYRYTLTYDRNSNITKADQADDSNADSIADGHVGFDIAYTMDNLNRLTVADEGTFSGGSITSRTRKQEWTLTQTGNWSLDKLDLNGDADWSDTDEWQDSKTFNKVNEIGTRDLDATPGTTGDNYTLAYDPAGNMTNDGTDYKYEWDAFYRLRKVKTQGGVLVAEYRYNGLGYRTGVHEDTDTDSDVDGSDLWYYSAYDERWRMVATYRSSDTDPKERFVHQQAGDGGFGGSSYIDLVAFREKDANTAWTSASDGTLEERLYYCQNQHADVVALITAAGGQREMDRYSAYGVPFGLPTGDCDSDGDCDVRTGTRSRRGSTRRTSTTCAETSTSTATRKCEEQESGWVEVKPPNLSWALAEPRSKSYCKDLRDSYDRAKKTGCGKSKP
jgi:YD repeat-containing protein